MYHYRCKVSCVAILAFTLFFSSCKKKEKKTESIKLSKQGIEKNKVFEKIGPSKTGITFSNDIAHDISTKENLFDFDYFYNGAGVGIEDLNNDGLLDLFFCGNQVDNRLYINNGNLEFTDITNTAFKKSNINWSNGVTFVDINNDGWKDIYVCQGGPRSRENRGNLLYINQKDNTFEEMAQKYGLQDKGISTQAAFFDYDKDGDLDCIVMNENELYGIDPINLYKLVDNNVENQYFNTSHFYRNDNGKFVDVTKEAGIQRPIFGLGLSISDINNDGWLDIYIASDYYIPDALFINNKNGTFSDKIKKYTNQTSYYGMGLDIADINNDGLQDIFVLDMASSDHFRSKTLMASMSSLKFDFLVNNKKFHHQYMYNTLQLNIGNNKFNNISHLSGTATTDWSWSVLMSDFDNDGNKDIYITNGYRKYALDNDLRMKVFGSKRKYGSKVPLDVKKKLYEEIPSEKLANILYTKKDKLSFKNVANEWGLGDFSFSNGAAVGDLDNDGDLDIVVNNIDENAFLYRNTTSDLKKGNFLKIDLKHDNSEPFAKVNIKYNHKSQFIESKRVRGYMSSHENNIHFGIGKEKKIDTLTITWPNGKEQELYDVPANTTLTLNEKNAIPKTNKIKESCVFKRVKEKSFSSYLHKENYFDDFNTEILLPFKQSTLGPFLTKGDLNGDNKDDIFIGGASGQPGEIFIQTNNGFRQKKARIFKEDKGYEDMESVFFDLEGDGDLDIYVVSGGNEFPEHSSYYADRIYINDGKGNFTKHTNKVLNSFPKSGKTVTSLDFDNDGDTDVLVGNRMIPKKYPNYSPSTLYENKNGVLVDVTNEVAKGLTEFGIINKIITTDFNSDGLQDFIAVGEWTNIGFFENIGGKFRNISIDNESLQDRGWWFTIKETDINNDGLKDYLVGNIGKNLKFKASKEKPLKIYAHDFDDNGSYDIVLSKKYNGEEVPVRGKECSSQQMPFINQKFANFKDFANASLTDIYGKKLKEAYSSYANEFNSIILINKGNNIFEKKILPIEAQVFPILDCVFYDINKDGFKDAIVAGNIYETEVETPRLDAFSGVILLSNGKDDFYSMPYKKSGIYMNGNVKSIELIKLEKRKLLLNTTNNGLIGTYQLN